MSDKRKLMNQIKIIFKRYKLFQKQIIIFRFHMDSSIYSYITLRN